MEYRNTPISGINLSPSQLMFNRLLRTKIPINVKFLNPKIWDSNILQHKISLSRQKQNYYCNKLSKELNPLNEGEKIYYDHQLKTWKPGTILKVLGPEKPRSYVILNELGNKINRNRRDIRPSLVKENISQKPVDFDDVSLNDFNEIGNNANDDFNAQNNNDVCVNNDNQNHHEPVAGFDRLLRKPAY
mgnify:CR=1 FL=1